jgi:hypothetical protein
MPPSLMWGEHESTLGCVRLKPTGVCPRDGALGKMTTLSSGGSGMDEIRGIDDPAVVSEVKRRVDRRLPSLGNTFIAILLPAILVLVASRLLLGRPTGQWQDFVEIVAMILLANRLDRWLTNRRTRVVRAKVLREMGRCTNCGCQLPPSSSAPCPKCGQRSTDAEAKQQASPTERRA